MKTLVTYTSLSNAPADKPRRRPEHAGPNLKATALLALGRLDSIITHWEVWTIFAMLQHSDYG